MPTKMPNWRKKEYPQKISASYCKIAREVDGAGK